MNAIVKTLINLKVRSLMRTGSLNFKLPVFKHSSEEGELILTGIKLLISLPPTNMTYHHGIINYSNDGKMKFHLTINSFQIEKGGHKLHLEDLEFDSYSDFQYMLEDLDLGELLEELNKLL